MLKISFPCCPTLLSYRILICHILVVTNFGFDGRMRTRTGAGGDIPEQSGERDPPPPPTMAEVLMRIEKYRHAQNRLLKALVQNTTPHGGGTTNRPNSFSAFLRTQPPIFTRAKDPLDVDHWLRTIEQKLALVRCEDLEKVLYAAHQLQDAAGAWWQGFVGLQPAGHQVTWAEFHTAFRAFHIPTGVMDIKMQEFLELKQGNKSVMDYVHEFNYLSQYAPEEVSSNARK